MKPCGHAKASKELLTSRSKDHGESDVEQCSKTHLVVVVCFSLECGALRSTHSPLLMLVELGTPVVPFCPFHFGVSLLKLNSGKKDTLII